MSMLQEFEIIRYPFNANTGKRIAEDVPDWALWPVVYFLQEEAQKKPNAYIGETIDIVTRLNHHLNHSDKIKLQDVYLISGEKFNKSVTLDIESNLIQYMSGDGKYKLLNSNLGLVNHAYYQRDAVYKKIFECIWADLIVKGISKRPLKEIDNSDLFKYSPYKSLSEDQTNSLILILEALANKNKKRFVIQGGAGSGKSVLAIFLFKLLNTTDEYFNYGTFGEEDRRIVRLVKDIKGNKDNLKMALVIPMESFRYTVQRIFKHVKGLSPDMVVGPADLSRNHYDIVLVDEAHRLRRRVNLGPYFGVFDKISDDLQLDKNKHTEVDWVLNRSDKSIFFYDYFQSVKPSDVRSEQFQELIDKNETGTEYLYSQFRVRGGKKYVEFVDDFLQCRLKKNKPKIHLKDYEFMLFHDVESMINRIKEKDKDKKLARIVAGYAWPWPSQKNKKAYDITINDVKLRWNSVKRNWVNSVNAINEVGCIHTVQGYDLNYAGIIFGKEIGYDKENNEVVIRKERYFDINGKNGITNPAELKRFILNIYKTLLLRGIEGTYVYVCDDELRDYFAAHIPSYVNTDAVKDKESEELIPFVNCVPLYDLNAAAGSFSEIQQVDDNTIFYPVPERIRISRDHFACKIIGDSMNKEIPNGSICLFRKAGAGTRNGHIVLASCTNRQDADMGSNYTVKKYYSTKRFKKDGSWEHESIVLMPYSTEERYVNIELNKDELNEFKIHGTYEEVLFPV